MDKTAVIVLAAGLGKRMRTGLPKVVTPTRERPLIRHVLGTVGRLGAARTVVVTGHMRERVEETVRDGARLGEYDASSVTFAVQERQLGTGDAVKAALPGLDGFTGTVVILYGDVPLVTPETLSRLLTLHAEESATVTVVSAVVDDPKGYGRIVRGEDGDVARIVEHKDCSPAELAVDEVNTGVYAVDSAFLGPAVGNLTASNAQGEYYITDIVAAALAEGQKVSVLTLDDAAEMQGVNDTYDLAVVDRALAARKVRSLCGEGVFVDDPAGCLVDPEVTVGTGSRLGPNVVLKGKCVIGRGVRLEGNAYLQDCEVGDGAVIRFSVRAENARIGPDVKVGPFAHLRPGTVIEAGSKVGNFVELKNTRLGEGSSVSHLTYLGDSEVGRRVNVGAGTITCNYDGSTKSKTVIGDDVFVGSNSSLVAPLTIGDGAVIGAGSVINKGAVEPGALALTRPPLVVRPGYRANKTKG